MGQKVNPIGIRLGITEDWKSKWYAKNGYAEILNQDLWVRRYLFKKYAQAALSRVQIDRPAKNARIILHTARPGIIIGKKGQDIDDLKIELSKKLGVPVTMHIEEIRKPELDSVLVAQGVAQQLEKRVLFRRAMKKAVSTALKAGAEGVKICVSGRLNGAEIARSEWYREGRVPLHTFRAIVDYGTATAQTTYGVIGVKVWICKGEIVSSQVKMDGNTSEVMV